MSFKSTINFFIKLQPSGKEIIKNATRFATIFKGFWGFPRHITLQSKVQCVRLNKKVHTNTREEFLTIYDRKRGNLS